MCNTRSSDSAETYEWVIWDFSITHNLSALLAGPVFEHRYELDYM